MMFTRIVGVAIAAALTLSGLALGGSAALAESGTTPVEYVTDATIRPDETTYLGWHEGAGAAGTYTSTPDGLALTGKVQILKGTAAITASLPDFAASLDSDATGEVFVQVPVFYNDGKNFTTLHYRVGDDSGLWTTSRALGSYGQLAEAPLADFVAQMGSYLIIGYGFFVDEGQTAVVRSFDAHGTHYVFTPQPVTVPTPPSPEPTVEPTVEPTAEPTTPAPTLAPPTPTLDAVVPGDGATSTPPVSTETDATTAGARVAVSAPVGVFAVGESVEIWLHSTPVLLGTATADAAGAVNAVVAIPATVAAGVHHIRFQSPSGYYWSTTAIEVASASASASTVLAVTGADQGVVYAAAAALVTGGVSLAVVSLRRRSALR
ncbi:hypothetical protein GCM10022198_01610 [Klugiella xanthotipulae]|uniref:Htaa protein n=1 Tax=Klugiella xanthotipulae TaxID=244735 RepID=A0A543I577_9MICO|nr:hypothetical protein [Klugiella xanthotipulae]TQM65701.1 hypothetical protein FB466_0513 [Klugiella xanthotipulae]